MLYFLVKIFKWELFKLGIYFTEKDEIYVLKMINFLPSTTKWHSYIYEKGSNFYNDIENADAYKWRDASRGSNSTLPVTLLNFKNKKIGKSRLTKWKIRL